MCRVANLNLLPRIFQRFFSPFFLINSSMASRAACKLTVLGPSALAVSLYILDSNLTVATLFSSRNHTHWCTVPPQSHGLPAGWSPGLCSSLRISQNRLGVPPITAQLPPQSPGGRGPQPLLHLKCCSVHVWYTVNTPTLMPESH